MIAVLPEVVIEVNGKALDDADARLLEGLRVRQILSAPSLCELTFRRVERTPALAPGASLRVLAGDRRELLFQGQVTAVEWSYSSAHGREVRVRGYDLLHSLRKRQPVRAHVQVTLRDLAREMVSDLGLAVEAAEPGPLWQRILQHSQSDLDLLLDLAERSGMYMTVRGNTLHLMGLDGTGESQDLNLGEQLLEASVELNGDPACRSVQAAGWDTARIEEHKGHASSARVGRSVGAEVSLASLHAKGERTLVDVEAQSDQQAEAIAQAELDTRVGREVTLRGTARGDAALVPGARINVSGLAEELCGRYVVTSATHTIDSQSGFLSEISTEPPRRQPRKRFSIAAPGMVTAVSDPDGLGRVRVSLPAYGGLETGWIAVLFPGAGAGKGFVALPDVGDRVLVLFAHEDPAQGVVLGGLYGAHTPPDTGVEGAAVRRFTLLTPGGQRLRMDDAKKSIRMEDATGSYIELSPDQVHLHACADLLLEAPGKAVVIQGQSIDFKRG